MKVKSLSHVRLFETLSTAAYQAPPPMGFSRQEYWSRVPLPSQLCMLLYIKQKNSKDLLYNTGNSTQYSVMTEKGGLRGGGRETGPKEGGICIHIADSLHCTAETNTTL